VKPGTVVPDVKALMRMNSGRTARSRIGRGNPDGSQRKAIEVPVVWEPSRKNRVYEILARSCIQAACWLVVMPVGGVMKAVCCGIEEKRYMDTVLSHQLGWQRRIPG